jgi:hypothetical protein
MGNSYQIHSVHQKKQITDKFHGAESLTSFAATQEFTKYFT